MAGPSEPNPPAGDPESRDAIPLQPLAPEARPAGAGAGPRIASGKSILQLVDDKCPNCGSKMDADAVVCMACGYDMKANEVLKPKTGVEYVEPEPAADERPEFIKPGGRAAVFAIAGVCVTLAACAAAVANMPRPGGFGVGAAWVLLIIYRAVLHTGTGLAALWCASKFVGERFTRLDLAAARIFLALSVFLLVASVRIPLEPEWLGGVIKWPIAIVGYWLAVFALFRRSRQETFIIALFHIGAMMFVELGVQMASWLDAAVQGGAK